MNLEERNEKHFQFYKGLCLDMIVSLEDRCNQDILDIDFHIGDGFLSASKSKNLMAMKVVYSMLCDLIDGDIK